MSSRLILLCAAILATSPLWAREKTDVIVMNNSDRITCEIKGLHSNTLYISVDYFLGTISVDWSKVDHIESKQLFLVRTQDGTVYTGALSTPEAPGQRPKEIEILNAPESEITLQRKQVIDMTQTSSSFWQRLNGQIGTGSNYSKGNESAQYNLNSDIAYPRPRWSAEANYSSNFTSSSGETASTRNEIASSAQRLMRWNNWYYTGITNFLQSSVQGIPLQTTLGGGVGRIIKNTGGTSFRIYGGFAWQQIDYEETGLSARSQQVSSGLIGTNVKLFRFDKTTLIINANLLPAISESRRVHFNLNSSYYVKIWGKLNWNFTFYGNWDSHPPAGFSTSDYGTSSGLSLSFGNH